MRKSVTAFVAAVSLLMAAVALPNQANAIGERERIFLGALFGAAAAALLAREFRPYAPVRGYYYYPGYSARYPIACPGGFWAARPLAYDRWGRPTRWSKPRWVCPPPGFYWWHYRYY